MRLTPISFVLLAVSVPASISSGASAPASQHTSPIPADSKQLLLVTSPNWSATAGLAQRFERSPQSPHWHGVGEPLHVNLGRHGMAWGRGLHQPERGPIKREGDGRTPAGVFPLGSLFGYADKPPETAAGSFPYIHIQAGTECVEDPRSPLYNRIVASRPKGAMLRADGVFRLGFVIEQNAPEAIPGAGSCVFFHVQRGPAQATSGCTSASLPDLESLVSWLEPKSKPLLVQLPQEEYRRLRKDWALPPQLPEAHPGD